MHSRRSFFLLNSLTITLGESFAQDRPRIVFSSRSIELPFGPNVHLRQLIARRDCLYALARTAGGEEIVHVNLNGQVISRKVAPPGTRCFLVEKTGEIITMQFRGKSTVIAGHSISEIARPEGLYAVAFLGSKLVGIGPRSLDTDLSQSTASTIGLPNDNLLVAELPDGTLALVAKHEQILWHLDVGLRMTSGIQLVAPELRSVPTRQQDDGSVIYAICADESGDVYCLATPYTGPEGARLLRFGMNGMVRDRMFLVMPEFPETSGQGDGRLQAGRMALHGKTVFVGSGTGKTTRVAYFSIA